MLRILLKICSRFSEFHKLQSSFGDTDQTVDSSQFVATTFTFRNLARLLQTLQRFAVIFLYGG